MLDLTSPFVTIFALVALALLAVAERS